MKRPFKASQYNRGKQKPDLSTDQAHTTDHDVPSLDIMQDSSPVDSQRRDQGAQKSEQPVDQPSMADRETSLLGIVVNASPELSPQSDPYLNDVLSDEQETSSLNVFADQSPLELSPQSDPWIKQISFADQQTTSLNALSNRAAAQGLPQSDRLADQTPIAEQETLSFDRLAPKDRFSSTHPSQDQTPVSAQETVSLPTVLLPGANAAVSSNVQSDQASVTEQQTVALPVLGSSSSTDSQKVSGSPPGFLRHMLNVGLARLQEPQPEGLLTRGLQAVRPGSRLGLVPLLAFTNAAGVFAIAASYYLSVWGYSYPLIELCFLGGLLCMFVPNLIRLLSREPSRLERISLLSILGLLLFVVPFMTSPQYFSSFDASLHWRTADDILRTNHLFSFNSMLPVSPYFPGLELITNAISNATGLNTFYAGNIVIIAARLLMVLALYLLYEHITSSSRMASIAMILYMANPHFLFFDTSYSYETLALPLAILMIYILARYGNTDRSHRWIVSTAWIVLAAVTVTHHMTNYVFDSFLLFWAIVSFFRPTPRKVRIHLIAIAVFAIALSLAYAFLLPGNPVWSYLSDYFGSAFGQLEQIITGTGAARPLFTSNVQTPPIWDKLFITGSIALVTFSLPFGLLTLQRRHRENVLAIVFGLASLLYPLTQAFRFTSFGTEITDRAAAFLFLPIAYILTILIAHFWPTRRLSRRSIVSITAIILVIYLGNIIVETGPNLTIIPGPYLVVADARSVEPEGIEAAMWSLANLGPDNHVATDRINQMLMSVYGDQRIVTSLGDSINVAPIFYSAQFTTADIALLRQGQIRYLVVDTRISTALPLEGTYFESDAPHSVIGEDALTKFNTVAQINRLFDSGDIVIYDTGAFLSGSSP